MVILHFISRGAKKNVGEDFRVSPSVNVGSPLSHPVVVGFEWVKDDVLKYHFSLTFVTSVFALQHQVKLASPEDSCKLAI